MVDLVPLIKSGCAVSEVILRSLVNQDLTFVCRWQGIHVSERQASRPNHLENSVKLVPADGLLRGKGSK